MANIPLQSISFPGLSDKYTTPTVDATLTQTGAAADAKKTGDEIGAIKNDLSEFPNGNYPQMGAGYANQLVSRLKKEDQTPYNFRAVPYDATLEEVEKIVGGTVAWNQRMDISNMADTTRDGITWKNNRDGTWTANGTATANSTIVILTLEHPSDAVKEGHKYFIGTGYDDATGASFRTEVISRDAENSNAIYIDLFRSTVVNAKKTGVSLFCELRVFSGVTANNFTFVPTLIDLTLVLGTAIADYVYSLEQSTAGAGVAWLKEHFPKQFDAGYQAYDAGTLKSIEGLSAKKTVGFNQWNEVWENGTINGQGQDAIGTAVRPKGYIPVFPNTAYYIPPVMDGIFWYDADKNFISLNYSGGVKTSPNNAHFVRFYTQASYGQTYNHDICINLSNPTKNGTYEPYEAHSYALDSDVVLRGIPKVDANGKLYYDGDEYLPDGTINRRFGIVDLGTCDWIAYSHPVLGDFFYANILGLDIKYEHVFNTKYDNTICSKYIAVGRNESTFVDKTYCYDGTNALVSQIQIKDSAYSDASAFKTAMSGVYLLYEKASTATETADPYTTPQIIVPDGTEEYIYADGSFELPVGHSSDYPVDVSGQLDDILDTPSANGTYVLKATVADGAVSYSWVADA